MSAAYHGCAAELMSAAVLGQACANFPVNGARPTNRSTMPCPPCSPGRQAATSAPSLGCSSSALFVEPSGPPPKVAGLPWIKTTTQIVFVFSVASSTAFSNRSCEPGRSSDSLSLPSPQVVHWSLPPESPSTRTACQDQQIFYNRKCNKQCLRVTKDDVRAIDTARATAAASLASLVLHQNAPSTVR